LPITCTDTNVELLQEVFQVIPSKADPDSKVQNPDAHENPELILGSHPLEWPAPEIATADTPPIIFEREPVAPLRPSIIDKARLGPLLVPSTKGIVDFPALGSAGMKQPLGRRRGPMSAADFKEAMRQMNESFGKAINEIVSETVACRG